MLLCCDGQSQLGQMETCHDSVPVEWPLICLSHRAVVVIVIVHAIDGKTPPPHGKI